MRSCSPLLLSRMASSESTCNLEDSEIRLRKSPPPFFRSSLVLFLILFGTGCQGVTDYCDLGKQDFWLESLSDWLNLAIQSGVIGFLITLIVSLFLYRAQLQKVREWDVTASSHPRFLPLWVIPALLIAIALMPAILFLPLDCSIRLAHIIGAWAGSFIGWGIVYTYYSISVKKILKN